MTEYKFPIVEDINLEELAGRKADIRTRGSLSIPKMKGWRIGAGNKSVRADAEQGLWLGHEQFVNAPFRVNVNGTLSCTGVIIRGTLNADDLVLGTLTGRRIRTSGTGSRVELIEGSSPSLPNSLVFYNLHGGVVGDIRGGDTWTILSGTYIFPSGTGVNPACVWEGPLGFRSLEVWKSSLRTRDITPLDTVNDLGSSVSRWRDIHLSQDCFVGRNIRITPQTGGTPAAGTLMFQSGTNRLLCHDGTAWRTISWV